MGAWAWLARWVGTVFPPTRPGARVLVGLSSESHSTQIILTPDEARAVLAELALAVAAIEGENNAD